jgi:hypothetical protein
MGSMLRWSIGISQGTIWLGPFLPIFPIFWISLACKFSNTKYICFSSWNTLVMNEAFGVFASLHLLDSQRTSNCWKCFNYSNMDTSLVRCRSEFFLQCILYEQYFRTQDSYISANNIILTVDAIVADWHMSWMFEITTSLIASIMPKVEKYKVHNSK